jgi:hypothetical protein
MFINLNEKNQKHIHFNIYFHNIYIYLIVVIYLFINKSHVKSNKNILDFFLFCIHLNNEFDLNRFVVHKAKSNLVIASIGYC